MSDQPEAAHGGALVNLLAEDPDARLQQVREALDWQLTERQYADVELLLDGAFSPLQGFMDRAAYTGVLESMRLPSGTIWPIPITLDVDEAFAEDVEPGKVLALRDSEGTVVAILEVSDLWKPDREAEAEAVYGTADLRHPGVRLLRTHTGPVCVGGRLTGLRKPMHYDFRRLRISPWQMRERLRGLGWRRVVAFQTRNPLHRAHFELTLQAVRRCNANLLLHPVVGPTQPGDVDRFTRLRCYQAVLPRYPAQTTTLAALNLAMRMAGPREAVLHGIIRRNFGATHLIVGRDHASPSPPPGGAPYHGPYDAQELFAGHQEELGIEMVAFRNLVYVEERAEYLPEDAIPARSRARSISGTELRRRLDHGLDIPDWFSFPEVLAELRRAFPPLHERGFTVFFTGLSGAGKSTIAQALRHMLLQGGTRRVTLLDGDVVRSNLSSELGFSRADRDRNILRIGYVAREVTRHCGIAICAQIAPYRSTREQVRSMVSAVGGFLEVYLSTPIEVCEGRDPKALYARGRAGLVKHVTGIDDPYEAPEAAELVIDTADTPPDRAAQQILVKLEGMGFLR